MKRILFLTTLFLLPTLALLAQPSSPTDLMLAGNQHYEAGQFAEAAQIYEQLVAQGLQDSLVFYNLGNAYFKQGDLGRAILNYRRAEQLTPRDADIRANLALARAQTIDQIKAEGEAFLSRLVSLAQTWLTLNEMAVLVLGLWFLFALLLIGFTWLRPGRWRTAVQYSMLAAAMFLVLGILSMGSRLYVERTRPAAVVVAAEADVTSGPGDQYITEFTLHSGAEVSLIEERPHWVRLRLPGSQLQGWVPADAVEAVQIE